MAKSQSESRLRGAFPPPSVIARSRRQRSNLKSSPRGSKQCLARAEEPLHFVTARSAKFYHCEECSDEAIP
jgi:hypothetical protein